MLIMGKLRKLHYARAVFGSLSHLEEWFGEIGKAALADARLALAQENELTSGCKPRRQRQPLGHQPTAVETNIVRSRLRFYHATSRLSTRGYSTTKGNGDPRREVG